MWHGGLHGTLVVVGVMIPDVVRHLCRPIIHLLWLLVALVAMATAEVDGVVEGVGPGIVAFVCLTGYLLVSGDPAACKHKIYVNF